MNFSLLEVIEGPKRLNSMAPTVIFDYANEAADIPERFYGLITGLKNHHPWAYLSLTLFASDVFPFKKFFALATKKVKMHEYKHGSMTLTQFYSNLVNLLRTGNLHKEERRETFILKAAENLTCDDLQVILTVLAQKNNKKIYDAFKRMHEDGYMESAIMPYFTFTYKDEVKIKETGNDIQSLYVSIKNIKRHFKCFDFIFDASGNECPELLDSLSVMQLALNHVRPGTQAPDICAVYFEDEKYPVLCSTPDEFFTLKRPKSVQSNTLPADLTDGASYLVEVDESFNVVSFTCYENKLLSTKKVTVDSYDIVTFPYLNTVVRVLILKVKDETICVFVPDGLDVVSKLKSSSLELTVYKGQHYLR